MTERSQRHLRALLVALVASALAYVAANALVADAPSAGPGHFRGMAEEDFDSRHMLVYYVPALCGLVIFMIVGAMLASSAKKKRMKEQEIAQARVASDKKHS